MEAASNGVLSPADTALNARRNLRFAGFSDRAVVYAFAGVVAALNGLSGQLLATDNGTFLDHVFSLGGVSAVVWFALFAICQIALSNQRSEPVGRRDLIAIALMLAAAIVPVGLAGSLATLLGGVFALVSSRRGSPLNRIATIMVALGGTLFVGPALLVGAAPQLLSLDAHLVGALSHSAVEGNTVMFAGEAQRFVVGIPCSSLHNISLAVLLWAAMSQLLGLRITPRLAAYGVAAAAGVFAVNLARLVMIARLPHQFSFLHEGGGAQAFGWLSLLVAAIIVGGGVIDVARRRV